MYPAASIDVDMSFGWMSGTSSSSHGSKRRKKKQKEFTGCCSQKRHPGIEKEEKIITRFHVGRAGRASSLPDRRTRF